MGLVFQSIARTGTARTGIARLNAGEVVYVAEGGALFAGAAAVVVDPYILIGSGVMDLSGDTSPSVIFTPAVADGIAIAAGTSPVIAHYLADASGVITTGGQPEIFVDYLADASGVITASGQPDITAHYLGNASGLAEFAGESPYGIEYTPSSGGLIETASEAPYYVNYIAPEVTGGLSADSSAPGTPEYKPDAGGSSLFDGTAPAYPEFSIIASGDASTTGTASPIVAHYIDIIGGQGLAQFDGVATVIFTIDVKGLPVFIRRFDGDIRLSLSQDGGIIKIRGGQPDMDDGMETAVNISLFSQGDWWGNALAEDGEQIGSTFLDSLRAPLTNQARLNVIESVRSALSWLTDTGISSSIDVQATIPGLNRLDISLTIRQPEKAPTIFRYTVNWQNQRVLLQEAAA